MPPISRHIWGHAPGCISIRISGHGCKMHCSGTCCRMPAIQDGMQFPVVHSLPRHRFQDTQFRTHKESCKMHGRTFQVAHCNLAHISGNIAHWPASGSNSLGKTEHLEACSIAVSHCQASHHNFASVPSGRIVGHLLPARVRIHSSLATVLLLLP